MKRYRVVARIILGFNGPREQYDVFIEPGETLESDGTTIWLVRGDSRLESITVGHAIGIWSETGTIQEA